MKKSSLLMSVAAIAALGLSASFVIADDGAAPVWDGFGGGKYFQRYSPLDQINAKNFGKLQIAWQRPGVDVSIKQKFPDLSPSNYLRGTPTFVNGVLYASNGVGMVEAFDAATGQTKWVQTPMPNTQKEASGQGLRGVEYWRDGDDERIISQRGEFLYALDAKTGQPVKSFGDSGRVYLGWPVTENYTYRQSSSPFVANDVIVVGGIGANAEGGGTGDTGFNRQAFPENIRGYDVRTGHLLWTFHIIPQEGEPGAETWGKDSWRYSGNGGNWGGMSADEELGYVYVPLTAPNVAYFGGHRPGNNLYTNSLVALDIKTGKLIWHYQLVHHDLWDYDTASPPILGDVRKDGKTVKAVMQANKAGYLYVFDRRTGEPVWPIEERPVPQSTVPGEVTSPTQPIPTKLPPFNPIGVKESDLMDFTPALRAEAKKLADQYVLGAPFAPPSIIDPAEGGKKGTLIVPGVWGSGNWNTGAFDPETGFYYAVSRTEPNVYGLTKLSEPATLDYSILAPVNPDAPANPNAPPAPPGANGRRPGLPVPPPALPSGLPLLKPPYGLVTAYDIGRGQLKWQAPNGDDPTVRANPALKGVKLPPLLGNSGRAAPLVTKTLLLLADPGDAVSGRAGIKNGAKLRAYDKASGKVVGEFALEAGSTGGPMSYEVNGKQFIVMPIGGSTYEAKWVAFTVNE